MGFLSDLHCLCVSDHSVNATVKSRISATSKSVPAQISVSCKAAGSVVLSPTISTVATFSVRGKVNAFASIKSSERHGFVVRGKLIERAKAKINPTKTLLAKGNILLQVEKFAGEFGDFDCQQKLYPVEDLLNSGFISSSATTANLYSFIDEGVFVGPKATHDLVSNDADYIQPFSYTTSGSFRYSAKVNAPIIRPDNSAFRFRASAPLFNRETDIPPRFSVKNIEFKDPSGNLIVRYKDFAFFGDGYFTTYSVLPQENRANLNDWNSLYPLMQLGSGYNLTFDVFSENLADPFDPGFDYGFEEYWRSQSQNNSVGFGAYNNIFGWFVGGFSSATTTLPSGFIDNLKISAIEICNSGGFGPRIENYINFYTEVDPTGRRLEKVIRPIEMPMYPEISEIWPVASSVWTAENGLNNTDRCGINQIIQSLRNDSVSDYIKMTNTGPISDSGRLLLKFGHENSRSNEVVRGSFGCAFDESTCGMWIEPSGAYNTLNKSPSDFDDNFFKIDSVSLKVLARKAVGSRDYALDVVGYSDDALLNVTRPSGGFLQNIEGVGVLPFISSVYPPDDLALAGESLSDKSSAAINFLEPSGGDHYLLATKPIISSTGFRWYEIPLKIFPDNVPIGASKDYSMSSYFENLYLDIYPIPLNAEIASMQLLVRYAPQNALNVTIQGGETVAKTDKSLKPISRQINDSIINAGSGYSPASLIQNLPQSYYGNNVKSNYSRRWRGMEGLVRGAFDPNQFGFDYNNPLLDYPFLHSYYDFNNIAGNTIYSEQGSNSGIIISTLPTYKYNNIGWRLINDSIFSADLPGYSGSYRTLDWTSLSNAGATFNNHILYGKIADAFSAAVRTQGPNSYIRSDNINISGGFAAYVRFTPGPNMSGVGYNLWNSGCLLAKYQNNNIQFAIGYSGGRLLGMCKNSANDYVFAQDGLSFGDYQYPLSIILTYNDNESQKLKLYTNNELNPFQSRLRAASDSFTMLAGSGDLYVGFAPTSGVGVNGFITEFAISNSGNLVEASGDLLYKETTVDTFFNNQHIHWWASGESYVNDTYKLWDYVNEDTQKDWNLGDFKYCNFGPAFSQLSKRTGRDLISFYIRNSGFPYSNFVSGCPALLNSGVSYHTQIENDFLRFNLSDVENNFYSTHTRITKNLPRGYKFAERAIVVETILEHESSGNISWGKCEETGPKFIVSLYTKSKEPYWTQNNWGLVNRSIHYLEPSSCLTKIHSTFNYKDYQDKSEKWALFPREPYMTEFTEKYYSSDVNDMILQYDLVYPSGTSYYSRINIHSANVRLEDSIATIASDSGNLNLLTEAAFVNSGQLNLLLDAEFKSSGLNLYTLGPIIYDDMNFPLFISGAIRSFDSMNLHTLNYIDNSGAINLYTSGSPSVPTLFDSGALNCYIYGRGIISNSGFPLVLINNDTVNFYPNSINLFSFGASGNAAMYASAPLMLLNEIPSSPSDRSGVLNAFMFASRELQRRYTNNALNLFIYDNEPKNQMNLVLFSNPEEFRVNNTLNLHTTNYYNTFIDYINWHNYDYGLDIELDDNFFASLPANDLIRGVDLIGYGACDSDSPDKAIDKAIITHDTVWRDSVCNDGGIFRAINTYTGSGYSGNYYGIRKYDGLLPNAAYNVNMQIKTGSTDSIPVPPEWEEWEYGTNNETNFDNVKLIEDYPSGISRNANDNYGYAVAVAKDLLAVGTPKRSIPDESGVAIPFAGSISLYKRSSEIAGKQASWEFLDELVLPSGYKKDYISATIQNMLCFPDANSPEFCVSGQKWNIGQEGRELGYSLDIANSGLRQVVVAGAPKAKWSRQFSDITISGVPIAMLVFTDAFIYDQKKIASIGATVNKWNILYKYFSAPWYSPLNFQPQIDLKLIFCQVLRPDDPSPPVNIKENWVYHTYLDAIDKNNAASQTRMISGIWDVFNKAFSYNPSLIDKNIPAIVGIFEDNSPSTTFGNTFKSASNAFIEQYLPYSYSGVVSSINGASLSGHVVKVKGVAERWENASNELINTALDYRNLLASGNLKYITSGVGQQFARSNSYEFQIPPASGGRVYIFENENNKFNLVQAIVSPNELNSVVDMNSFGLGDSVPSYSQSFVDMFGQSVAISSNGEIITIGSPYINEACQIYERQDSENDRMYLNLRSWLNYKNLSANILFYDNLLAASGFTIAAQQTYYGLSQSQKFNLRTDENFWKNNGGPINLYHKVFDYSYSDIAYTGTWQWLVNEYAGSSRLGWDTDINDDGTVAIFGAPTDSFNEYDDTNIWFDETNNTWASYTNAGAARVFESRNYYPHNLVVEYYKFGNLDRNTHPELEASGNYDQMGEYFSPLNIPFKRTAFSEINIPKEAGLAFIITPEIDAASDEIIARIKEWLSLGDRTLVLVGNDPVWEDNGLYNNSNKIVNKILDKLGSRMQLVAARNEYESLPYCADVLDKKYNITASYVPNYAHDTIVSNNNMYARGVGDVKINLSRDNLENLFITADCDEELNPYCEMPIKHMGDLRAEWSQKCIKNDREVFYKENWPFHFGNTNPAQQCDDYPANPHPIINSPNLEPRPILTAAEWLPEQIIEIPARSGCRTETIPIYKRIKINEPYWEFAENHIPSSVFSIYENTASELSGVFNNIKYGNFIDPEIFVDIDNTRDAFLQATGTPYFIQQNSGVRKVDDYQTIIAQDKNVVLISTQLSENDFSFNNPNAEEDFNYLFYSNLVAESCENAGIVAQLGGWTGRIALASGYINSILKNALESFEHTVIENYTGTPSLAHNILWIVNPINKPSDSDIESINNWLNDDSLNRKVVITYNNNQAMAQNITYICDKLNLNMKPFYSESEGKYLTAQFGSFITDPVSLNSSHPVISGCNNGYEWLGNGLPSTKVENFIVSPDIMSNSFIPISGGTKVIYYNKPLNEQYFVAPDKFWKIDAKSSVEFSTTPGSGYRIFINWVSEGLTERYRILSLADGVSGPDPDASAATIPIGYVGSATAFADAAPTLHVINMISADFKAPLDKIDIRFLTDEHFKLSDKGFVPKTPRILSISGCLLPIEEKINTFERDILIGWETICTPWYEPPYNVIIPPVFRPISTDGQKYCLKGCDDQQPRLMQDGPIVVAEEYENFSSFSNGSQRSKIVVISDSTIVQGRCPEYRNGTNDGNQTFIRSLYPPSPNNQFIDNLNFELAGGKQFEFVQKLIAPERGSPGKYHAISGIAQLATNFGTGIYNNTGVYTSNENNYNPATLSRKKNPKTDEERKQRKDNFEKNIIPLYRVFPRLSGQYLDPTSAGGIPDRFKAGLPDLVYEHNNYTGDLFGYSVAIHGDQIIVGAPANGFIKEQITNWTTPLSSGDFHLNASGGAGAAFTFQKTFARKNGYGQIVPWEFKQKIRPSSLMPGDQFGYSLSLDADFTAIGSPKHDYKTSHQHIYAGSAAFIRKEFAKSFDIPAHIFNNYEQNYIKDIGAVFTYQNKLIDWQNRTKQWQLAERINASGYQSPQSEDNFGAAVYIDRARRIDGDYTLVVGAPTHDYPTSGNHYTGTLSNAGATFIYDAMLREQADTVPNSGSWISAKVFGANNNDNLKLKVYQNTAGDSIGYNLQGLVFTNNDGEIYLEASGFDPASKGFIAHRPFVEFIKAQIADGTEVDNTINMFISGAAPINNNQINLVTIGPDRSTVYNSMNLHTASWNTTSGIMNMHTVGASGIGLSGILNIITSGIGEFNSPLNLRIRGK